jgi:hypothetical protein
MCRCKYDRDYYVLLLERNISVFNETDMESVAVVPKLTEGIQMRLLRNLRMVWLDARITMMENRAERLAGRTVRVKARRAALRAFYNAMDKAWKE